MTDRELLYLAAKACGIEPCMLDAAYDNWEEKPVLIRKAWNPITDAADRVRMCDKLGIDTMYFRERVLCYRTELGYDDLPDDYVEAVETYADHNNDRTLAANCAAVRVAAEIGRAVG